MLSYELAKQLKDAGFKQGGESSALLQTFRGKLCEKQYGDDYDIASEAHKKECGDWDCKGIVQNSDVYLPTLEELIEACGDCSLLVGKENTIVLDASNPMESDIRCEGSTPIEAVARLWLALNSPEKSGAPE